MNFLISFIKMDGFRFFANMLNFLNHFPPNNIIFPPKMLFFIFCWVFPPLFTIVPLFVGSSEPNRFFGQPDAHRARAPRVSNAPAGRSDGNVPVLSFCHGSWPNSWVDDHLGVCYGKGFEEFLTEKKHRLKGHGSSFVKERVTRSYVSQEASGRIVRCWNGSKAICLSRTTSFTQILANDAIENAMDVIELKRGQPLWVEWLPSCDHGQRSVPVLNLALVPHSAVYTTRCAPFLVLSHVCTQYLEGLCPFLFGPVFGVAMFGHSLEATVSCRPFVRWWARSFRVKEAQSFQHGKSCIFARNLSKRISLQSISFETLHPLFYQNWDGEHDQLDKSLEFSWGLILPTKKTR